jgi:hypothetical protein
LALGALAAIDEKALAAGGDQHRRQAALGRGGAGGGAEKGQIEHPKS